MPEAVVVGEGGSNAEEEEVGVVDEHHVPLLPPITPTQPEGWLCCGVEYSQKRKRCGLCRKWKEGKREHFMR